MSRTSPVVVLLAVAEHGGMDAQLVLVDQVVGVEQQVGDLRAADDENRVTGLAPERSDRAGDVGADDAARPPSRLGQGRGTTYLCRVFSADAIWSSGSVTVGQ